MSAEMMLGERLGEMKARLDAQDKTIAALTSRVAKLERGAPADSWQQSAGGGQSDRVQPASDADLDGQHGNPEIRFDPKEKYWKGPSYVGRLFSQCPADYLDAQAKHLEASAWGLEKGAEEDPTDADAKRKKARFKRLDAARAKGWADRVRAGRGSAQPAATAPRAAQDDYDSGFVDEEPPF